MARGSFTDRSGTITTGATAQTIAAADQSRRFLYVQNISDTAMQVNIGGTATADSIPLAVSTGSIRFDTTFCPTGAVSLLCATTGKKFICKTG